MQPHTQVTQIEQYDEELNLLRLNIHEDFYQQYLLPFFNSLGQFDFKDYKQVSPQNIEMFQYLTLPSIQKNFHKVFGANNDMFAEMFYNYLSDGAPYMHINIKQFIKKYAIFWPKKKLDEEEEEAHKKKKTVQDFYQKLQEERQRMKDLNRIAFDFYDIDKDGYLSVLDLIKLQTSFDDTSGIGKEVTLLMDIYQNNNVRPKYVKEPLTINFERYNQMIEESCIIQELQYAIVDAFFKPDEEPRMNVYLPNPANAPAPGHVEIQDKKKYYNFDVIFDKDLIKLKLE